MRGGCEDVRVVELRSVDAASWADQLLAVHEAAASAAYAHIFCGPFPREEAARRWRGYCGSVVVAVQDTAVVGFVACRGEELDALYVLPAAAGRGIGSRLLSRAAGAGLLWVLAENRPGRRFYERHGWQATGEVRTADEGVPEVRYRRGPSTAGS